MKRYFTLIAVLMSCFCLAQNNNNDEYERVYVEAGFVAPIGKLNNQFQTSPSFGFWLRSKQVRGDFLDIGFNFFIPKNPKDVAFKNQDTILQYKSKHFGINTGVRYAKVFALSGKNNNSNVEWNSGIGIALNVYKAPSGIKFGEEGSGEVFATFFVSQGLKLNFKNMGLQCHYQFSPYALFDPRIDSEYGSQSIMFGIVYRQ